MKKLFAFLVMSALSLSAAHAEVDNPFGSGSATSTTQNTATTPVKKTTTTSQKKTTSSKTKSSLGGSCGSYPRTCGQMKSCAQAREALKCGNTRLDRDHDGIPCESICGG